jgi:hypothetical protein
MSVRIQATVGRRDHPGRTNQHPSLEYGCIVNEATVCRKRCWRQERGDVEVGIWQADGSAANQTPPAERTWPKLARHIHYILVYKASQLRYPLKGITCELIVIDSYMIQSTPREARNFSKLPRHERTNPF